MITRQRKQTALHRLWMPAITAAFLGYFGFHAYSGSYGLKAWDVLEREETALTLRLGYLRERRRGMERKIAALHPDSLDIEAVDMRARAALNMIRDDEVVVPLGALQ